MKHFGRPFNVLPITTTTSVVAIGGAGEMIIGGEGGVVVIVVVVIVDGAVTVLDILWCSSLELSLVWK